MEDEDFRPIYLNVNVTDCLSADRSQYLENELDSRSHQPEDIQLSLVGSPIR
jgi:hypothetical protein